MKTKDKKYNVKHKISTRQISGEAVDRAYRSLLRQAVTIALRSEAINLPCNINVLITDDAGIRVLNKEHRGIDRATDVLSFPLQYFTEPGWHGMDEPDIDLCSQTVPLGDIVISLETIKRHARRYKCTFEQETTRMILHSTLHLLGYGHGAIMRRREENLMQEMGYVREI